MAQAISVSLPEEVLERLNDECSDYSDNRSALVTEAVRSHLGMGGDE